MEDYTASMDAEGVPYEVLTGAEVRERWPVWSGLADDVTALFQSDDRLRRRQSGGGRACSGAPRATAPTSGTGRP